MAVPLTHIFFHFQTLVRWPYHSRTYSSIFKLLCGGRTTHARILPFSKLWCGGRTTHAHILPFLNSCAVAVPLTHIFFHFQTLVRWPYHSRTYSSIFKLLCGGRTTHARILPFSKLWCGGRTTHAHIPPFQKLWCGGRTTHALILNSKVQCGGRTTHARVPKVSSLPGRT